MSRSRKLLAVAFWGLWLYLACRAVTGWIMAIHGRPEASLCGAWQSGGMRLECRPDGSVASGGRTSGFVRWEGSRLVFHEAELTAAVRNYEEVETQWEIVLARKCGIVCRMETLETLDGPRVNHRQVDDTIQATVHWTDKDHFTLGTIWAREE